jgi:hypothetical protein
MHRPAVIGTITGAIDRVTLLKERITRPPDPTIGVVIADRSRQHTPPRRLIAHRATPAIPILAARDAQTDEGMTKRRRAPAIAVVLARPACRVGAADLPRGTITGVGALDADIRRRVAQRAILGAVGVHFAFDASIAHAVTKLSGRAVAIAHTGAT